jgi:hypothetical protein
MVSSRHLAITRQTVDGKYRWVVTDLQSRNGLFVRVRRAVLVHQSEMLIGSGRYRFEIAQRTVPETIDFIAAAPSSPGTRGFSGPAAPGAEVLTEINATGTGNRYVLTQNEYWIGRDLDCEICRAEDPFANRRHVRLVRNEKGTWHAEHNKTINGLWYRVPQVKVADVCQFQIGEQRFRLTVGGRP